ncbi:MAG: hypothetical protein QXD43_00605 [Candidatus Aenigmatarchaeota archaeon]
MKKQKYTKCYKCGKISKLFRCKYCGNYFCNEHSEPKMPLTPDMVFNEKDKLLKQLYESEWRKKEGHACVSYGEWKLNEIKRKKEIDNETLNKALDSIEKIPLIKPSYERFKPIRVSSFHSNKTILKTLKNIFIIIIIVIIIFGFILYIYNNPKTISIITNIIPSFKPKPTYYCDSNNTLCNDIMEKCIDSIIITDTTTITIKEDITNKNTICHILFSIDKSVFSGWKGLSMTCDFPISNEKVNYGEQWSIEFFKYCEGSLKDKWFETMGNMFGLPI